MIGEQLDVFGLGEPCIYKQSKSGIILGPDDSAYCLKDLLPAGESVCKCKAVSELLCIVITQDLSYGVKLWKTYSYDYYSGQSVSDQIYAFSEMPAKNGRTKKQTVESVFEAVKEFLFLGDIHLRDLAYQLKLDAAAL